VLKVLAGFAVAGTGLALIGRVVEPEALGAFCAVDFGRAGDTVGVVDMTGHFRKAMPIINALQVTFLTVAGEVLNQVNGPRLEDHEVSGLGRAGLDAFRSVDGLVRSAGWGVYLLAIKLVEIKSDMVSNSTWELLGCFRGCRNGFVTCTWKGWRRLNLSEAVTHLGFEVKRVVVVAHAVAGLVTVDAAFELDSPPHPILADIAVIVPLTNSAVIRAWFTSILIDVEPGHAVKANTGILFSTVNAVLIKALLKLDTLAELVADKAFIAQALEEDDVFIAKLEHVLAVLTIAAGNRTGGAVLDFEW